MFQEGSCSHTGMSANVAYGVAHPSRRTRSSNLAELLDQVGLAGFGRRPIASLSGGRRSGRLPRSLAPATAKLLLDEPLSALDRALRAPGRGAAGHARATGTTAVHDARSGPRPRGGGPGGGHGGRADQSARHAGAVVAAPAAGRWRRSWAMGRSWTPVPPRRWGGAPGCRQVWRSLSPLRAGWWRGERDRGSRDGRTERAGEVCVPVHDQVEPPRLCRRHDHPPRRATKPRPGRGSGWWAKRRPSGWRRAGAPLVPVWGGPDERSEWVGVSDLAGDDLSAGFI